jgi:hypothetical protein
VEKYLSELRPRAAAPAPPDMDQRVRHPCELDAEHGDLPDAEETGSAVRAEVVRLHALRGRVAPLFFILGKLLRGQGSVRSAAPRPHTAARVSGSGGDRTPAGGRASAGAASPTACCGRTRFARSPMAAHADVLVAWADKDAVRTVLRAAFDWRRCTTDTAAQSVGWPSELGAMPVFAVRRPARRANGSGAAARARSRAVGRGVFAVVMQAVMPQARSRLDIQAYSVSRS